MSALSFATFRRCLLAVSATAGALALVALVSPNYARASTTPQVATVEKDSAIRPFKVNIPEDAVADLRKRVLATRWPDRETVNDQSQGVQLAKLQALVGYWGTQYAWRKVESQLNALPMFVTNIDGLDIQFIHVKSKHPNEKSLTKDEILDGISLYWLTNSAISSARLYWENNTNNFNAVEQKTRDIKIPVAVTVFPGEIYQAPKTWTERAYPNLIYFNEVDKGGHFAAWEQPELFAKELRAAFRTLR